MKVESQRSIDMLLILTDTVVRNYEETQLKPMGTIFQKLDKDKNMMSLLRWLKEHTADAAQYLDGRSQISRCRELFISAQMYMKNIRESDGSFIIKNGPKWYMDHIKLDSNKFENLSILCASIMLHFQAKTMKIEKMDIPTSKFWVSPQGYIFYSKKLL